MNKNYKTIEINKHYSGLQLWLNRPEVHNAFNEEMIDEILDFFVNAELEEQRFVMIRGRGKSFCAGADLNWMKSVVNYEYKQNLDESINLSECFSSIYNSPVPTIAVVHGNAIGGANGILSACDMVYAFGKINFSLSEVKIGLTPACISPYVLKRVGEFNAKELMITGKRFDGPEAEKIGLINRYVDEDILEEFLEDIIQKINSAGPEAVKVTKTLINNVVNNLSLEEAKFYTAEVIAGLRKSDEGQEGMNSFLEKRKPNWNE